MSFPCSKHFILSNKSAHNVMCQQGTEVSSRCNSKVSQNYSCTRRNTLHNCTEIKLHMISNKRTMHLHIHCFCVRNHMEFYFGWPTKIYRTRFSLHQSFDSTTASSNFRFRGKQNMLRKSKTSDTDTTLASLSAAAGFKTELVQG